LRCYFVACLLVVFSCSISRHYSIQHEVFNESSLSRSPFYCVGGDGETVIHTKGTPTGKPTGPLKTGEYWWILKFRRKVPL